MKTRRRKCLAALAVVFAASAFALVPDALAGPTTDYPEDFLDAVLDQYRSLALGWHAGLSGPAQGLFFSLLTVQGILLGGQIGFAQHQGHYGRLPGLTSRGIRFLIFGAAASLLMTTSDRWIPAIYRTFVQAGNLATTGTMSTQGPSAGAMVTRCFRVVSTLLESAWDAGVVAGYGSFQGGHEVVLLAVIVTVLSFIGIGVQIVLTEVSFYVCLGAAPFFLAFSALPQAAGLAEGYLKFLLYVSVKVLVLFLLLGVVEDLPINALGLFTDLPADYQSSYWQWISSPISSFETEMEQYRLTMRAVLTLAAASLSSLFIVGALPVVFARMVSRHVDFDIKGLAG